jgi:hypothetical protein
VPKGRGTPSFVVYGLKAKKTPKSVKAMLVSNKLQIHRVEADRRDGHSGHFIVCADSKAAAEKLLQSVKQLDSPPFLFRAYSKYPPDSRSGQQSQQSSQQYRPRGGEQRDSLHVRIEQLEKQLQQQRSGWAPSQPQPQQPPEPPARQSAQSEQPPPVPDRQQSASQSFRRGGNRGWVPSGVCRDCFESGSCTRGRCKFRHAK